MGDAYSNANKWGMGGQPLMRKCKVCGTTGPIDRELSCDCTMEDWEKKGRHQESNKNNRLQNLKDEIMATMGELYGNPDDTHEACPKCGYCLECGDCRTYGCGLNEAKNDIGRLVDRL